VSADITVAGYECGIRRSSAYRETRSAPGKQSLQMVQSSRLPSGSRGTSVLLRPPGLSSVVARPPSHRRAGFTGSNGLETGKLHQLYSSLSSKSQLFHLTITVNVASLLHCSNASGKRQIGIYLLIFSKQLNNFLG
jgi:hypothetical protein